jgi:tellurite resistance protein TerC
MSQDLLEFGILIVALWSSSGSTCTSSRAAGSRTSAKASSGASAGSCSASSRRSSCSSPRAPRRPPSTRRLPHRAVALARQPVRLPAAVQLLRRPVELRARLLFFGIVFALVLRGLAILGGLALLEQFEFIIYVLGVTLLILAYRILRGVSENVDPDKNIVVRLVRRLMPVTDEYHGNKLVIERDHKRHATPLLLCLGAIVAADIAFAVDSIPAAFAITDDAFVIWMGNVFALLGLRALFVLVEALLERFRYLDQTIAVVLALVGIKLLIEDIVKIGPVVSLLIVFAAFVIGMTASVIVDRRVGPEKKHAPEPGSEPSRARAEPGPDARV